MGKDKMSALSNENYVKAVVGAYAGYGLAMAAIPDRLSDDHFEGNTNSKETRFFARGAGTTMLGLACALTKLGSDDALKLATAMTVLTGIVFLCNVFLNCLWLPFPVGDCIYVTRQANKSLFL